MSKGQRSKKQAEDIVSAGTHLAAREKKNSVLKKIAIWIGAIAVIVFLIGMQIFNYMHDSGFKERRTVALSTENYSVSSSQLMYFFGSTYQNMVNTLTSYGMSSYIDTSKSLKSQTCTFDSSKTWFEYFMDSSVASAKQVLALCEAARADGLDVDDSDRETAKEVIETLEETAKSSGYTLKNYLKTAYGSAVSESDVEHAIELSSLAQRYADKCVDAADISDSALEEMYAKDPDSYDKVSYLTYTFDYEDLMPEEEEADEAETDSDETTSTTEEDPTVKAEAVNKSHNFAHELAECTDEASFKEYVKNYLVSLGTSEDDAAEAVEALEKTDVSYNEDDEEIAWAFTAKAGEAKMFEDDEEGEYTVIFVTSERGRDEDISSRDVRHILFKHDTYEDDSKVNEVYNKWVEDGAKVEDFDALAAEYSEDPGSSSNGGLYEGVTEGEMIDEFDAWLFDEARQPGDHAIVETESYGWHIMYYVGGTEGWKAEIISDIQDETKTTAINNAEETYTVTIDEEAIENLGN